MVGRGHGVGRMRQPLVGNDLLVIARLNRGAHCGIKLVAGRRARRVVPLDLAQVVHHVAASQHHEPLVTQRRKATPQVVGVAGVGQAVHRELHHRHVGLGEHVVERSPDAVIDTPGVVHLHVAAKELSHARGELGAAGRAILDRVELRRKTVHVVHLARRGIALHERPSREPVGRDGKNRARLVCQDLLAHCTQAVRHLVIAERHHGIAVAHKHRHLPFVCHLVLHCRVSFVLATWYLFCTYLLGSILHAEKCYAIGIF